MSQLILSAHSGSHDAVAAVFDDYELKAAVQLERLTRRKSDGREHPDLAIDEVLSIAGATRNDVDVVCFSRSEFPTIFYRNIRGVRWIREKYRKYVEGNTRRYMPPEFLRYHTTKIDDIFDVPKFRRAGGFRDDAAMFFYNHHESHALAPLFYTDWNDALLVTADGGGDTVNYSHRHLADGALTTIYGGEECLLTPLPTDSLGHAYETVTGALGFIPRRHEGKLTGLAAFGQPVLAEKIGAHFSVDDSRPRAFGFPRFSRHARHHPQSCRQRQPGRRRGLDPASAGRHHAALGRAAVAAPQGAASRSRRRRLCQCAAQSRSRRTAAAR